MKNIVAVITTLLFIACSDKQAAAPKELSDLTFYLKTDVKIDSILFTNFTQDREYITMPYSDTLRIDLKDSMNDYYFIDFFTKNGPIMFPFWLDGKNVVIKGEITSRLKVDTVIGSPLYYKANAFKKQFTELLQREKNNDSINSFLWKALKENIGSPFSIDIANQYFRKNVSDKESLKKLYELVSTQEDAIKNSLLHPYKEIGKILNTDQVILTNYQFYNTENKLTTIKPLKGKKHLIDFWFVACAPCIADHQVMAGKLEKLDQAGVAPIGISIDQKQEEWQQFVQHKKYSWPNFRETDNSEKNLRTSLLISGFPTYLLIDDEGKILYRAGSFAEVAKYLKL